MKIAIVEDDINMRKSLEIALGDYDEFEVKTFRNAKEALKKLDDSYDLVISDINMPGMSGIEFIAALEGRYEVIIITGNATLGRAIESIRLGVRDFLTKPFEVETLVEAIRRSQKAKERTIKREAKPAKEKSSLFYGMSDALQKSLSLAKKAARSDAAVLLLGESGVGKELFAKTIHDNSSRSKGPFVAVNMAAIPKNLIESELFGFEKGAFTDAVESKIGKFEA
ncbi:MAG: sigma 54-interacting transcriptional regulator, partial [Hydrogenimonas sp.]|nr:sigma 54-interacting transcriptional regulator [Hydrogenimonas sp.]